MNSELENILSSFENRRQLWVLGSRNESFKRKFMQLETDMRFLNMFVYIVDNHRWSYLPWQRFSLALLENTRNIARTIYNVLVTANLSGIESAIDESQRQTDIAKATIREVLDDDDTCGYLSTTSFSFPSHFGDGLQWTSFLGDLSLILVAISREMLIMNDGSYKRSRIEQVKAVINSLQEVMLYEQFIADLKKYLDYSSFPPPTSLPVIVAFLNRVRSVAVRIGIQSCNYWLSDAHPTSYISWFCSLLDINAHPNAWLKSRKFSGFVDLYDGIDPVNPEFLELNLNFLKAIRKFSPSVHQFFSLDYDFIRSILVRKGDYHFKGQMMHLVAIVITNKLDYSREDVHIFFEEIRAALEVATSLPGPSLFSELDRFICLLRSGVATSLSEPSLFSELDKNICLLRTEYFLKVLLNDGNFHVERFEFMNYKDRQVHDEMTHNWNRALTLIEEVEIKLASLRLSCFTNKCSKSMLKNSLLQFLLEIVIYKAVWFLLDLKSSTSAMTHETVQIESLLELLTIFHLTLTNELNEDTDKEEIIFIQVEAFARRIYLYSYSFFPNKITEEKPAFSFAELLDKAQHIRAKLKEISPKFPVSNFPTTCQMGFIDFLLRDLGELLKYSPKSIVRVKGYIKEIRVHLKSSLMKVSDPDMENPVLKDLFDHLIDVAYKVNYVIDSIELGAHLKHFFWFYDLLEELRLVDRRASNVPATSSDANVQNVNNVNQDPHDMISQGRGPATGEVLLDRKDKEDYIIKRLTSGSSQRDIFSIVGMPGIGKTTLAMKVYNRQEVKGHFHRLAWCNVSQVYEKKRLLLEIINGIQGSSDKISQMSTEDLELKLRQCLLKNKYLLVMDDLWSVGAWDDFKSSFPDNCNGSRILLTTRHCNVALEINPDSEPWLLHPFSEEESWMLLERKVFKGNSCPQYLSTVGKEIAHQCQGLPLAVVTIAGLLERTERSQNWWTTVSESFSSQIINDPESRYMEILELSYNYLPEHLKACFLYLGFLEDNHIPVTNIIRFWLAEGFIKTESKSLEDVAEEYLMDLINRNLVMISKRRFNGNVKECCLHGLLRDFCQLKANEEKFFQSVTRSDEPYASFPRSDNGIEFDFDYHSDCNAPHPTSVG